MLSTKKYSHNLKESYFIWWECLEFWARETETPYQLLLFNCSVVSNSLWPHGLQHARFLCPSLSHGAGSNSCPLSQWCHPTIPFSVVPFSSHLQSFPASGFFPMSWLFTSGGQTIGASASASVLPMNIQGWSWQLWENYSKEVGVRGVRLFTSFLSRKPAVWTSKIRYQVKEFSFSVW